MKLKQKKPKLDGNCEYELAFESNSREIFFYVFNETLPASSICDMSLRVIENLVIESLPALQPPFSTNCDFVNTDTVVQIFDELMSEQEQVPPVVEQVPPVVEQVPPVVPQLVVEQQTMESQVLHSLTVTESGETIVKLEALEHILSIQSQQQLFFSSSNSSC